MQINPKAGQELLASDLATWLFGTGTNKLLVIMGLPASGKSTLCEFLEKLGAARINRDLIRKRLYGDEGTYGDLKVVNAEYYKDLRAALAKSGVVLADNVNITFNHRRGTIEAAREAGYTDISIVWVDVPLDVCLERNRARQRHVPEDAMRSMYESQQKDGLPRESEGNLVILNSGKDREHYMVNNVREGIKSVGTPVPEAAPAAAVTAVAAASPVPAPAPVPPAAAPNKGEQQRKLVSDIQVEVNLLDACVNAGRFGWAAEVLATLKEMTEVGQSLFFDGSKPGGGNSGGPAKKPWIPPTPEQVTETLLKMIGHRPYVTGEGDLVVLTFNGHLLTKEKAEQLQKPLLELIKRAHIIFIQESNVDAVRILARAAGYGLIASHRNNRGQACAILFHKRLQWLGKSPVYHDYLTDVPNHPEFKASLRPALQRRVRDLATGFILDVINFHTKSNLGGPDETRPVRRWQFGALVTELEKQKQKSPYEARDAQSRKATAVPGSGDATVVDSALEDNSGWELPLGAVIVGGDYNTAIENPASTEIEPLIEAGFARVTTPDNRWSYQYRGNGGQFDGFFVRGLDGMVKECFIPPFFPAENRRDSAFYRELSDHLPVFAVIGLPKKAAVQAPAQQPAEAAPAPASAAAAVPAQ